MIDLVYEKLGIGYEKTLEAHEQLQNECDYARAQRILESMLEKGLISTSEFNKITVLNRESFAPILASIMAERR